MAEESLIAHVTNYYFTYPSELNPNCNSEEEYWMESQLEIDDVMVGICETLDVCNTCQECVHCCRVDDPNDPALVHKLTIACGCSNPDTTFEDIRQIFIHYVHSFYGFDGYTERKVNYHDPN